MSEPRIWILPPEVAERIAAGEVVERPASVVKELVENALDAGASRITVETEAGGKALLRVTDDGQGMTPEEVGLAIQRHATSKLRTADDLFNIHTLGFRGEALPSIAAVSEMEILTRTPTATEGARVLIEGGEVRAVEPAAAPVGTTIRVRRLFFNVPVREKFLRSDTAESNQITELLQRLALSRAGVSFRLIHDGREALLSPGSQDALNAVVAVLGRPIARDLLRLPDPPPADEAPSPPAHPHTHTPTHPYSAIHVSGFVGRPTLSRANRGQQHFYVNGRAVRSPLFYRALDDAFRSTMPQGRHPVAVVFVEVPPDFVDVNVHPAKTEIRFQDESAIHGAIREAVQQTLRSDPASLHLAPPLLTDTPTPYGPGRVAEPGGEYPAAPPSSGALPFAEAAIGGPAPHERWRDSQTLKRWDQGMREEDPGGTQGRTGEEGEARETASPGEDPFAETGAGSGSAERAAPAPGPSVAEMGHGAGPALRDLTLLGQAEDLFILAEEGGRLWIIDQHVAHERVLFDRMLAPGRVAEASQALLLPAVLDVDRAQALALEEHQDLLEELGFQVEAFGPNRYRLRGVPRSLQGQNYETVLRDLADELAEQSQGGQVRLRKEQVAAAAAGRSCKRAVKAGNKLSAGEMQQLLTDLRSTRNPYTCPHGRPVFLTFDEEEIRQLFGGRSCE
jgi:DNA mismatch repair protein MutL